MNEKKILIVEDDQLIRYVFEEGFENAGYTVKTAEHAEQALDILKQDDAIQVMFLDLNLPGMNGIELCKIIKKDNPLSTVYAVTGFVSIFELSNCLEAGFDDYFTKPVNLDVLLKAAQRAFEKTDMSL
ncbi:MAG: response regulator [Desulfobacteraceae bacterium]|nr:response regulator [Desulfobacteraceae bacterium]